MKKLFLTMALIFGILNFGTANAEQPAAETYRQIFQSDNFYLEFKDKWGERILTAENGIRMERMSYKYERGNMVWLNPLGAIFGGKENKNPEIMYKDGIYFQFIGKNQANYCAAKDINSESINPRSGWDKIPQKLALPDELAVFLWDDAPFKVKNSKIPAPNFQESYKKIFKVNGKDIECECDLYACELNGAKNSGVLYYELAYAAGELVRAKRYISRNGNEYDLNVLEIVKIQSETPEGTFSVDEKNIQCYAPRMGDMADLLEQSQSAGTMQEILNKGE
ncbi:MAG: hypothetical protein IJT73_07230 [Selenomonadaceae bacterium]|nr:hypothetical protein [Selenomonadaceae bacterium]